MGKPAPSFDALRSEWNARLRADGLVDIESEDNPDGPVRARYWSPLDAEATAEYYRQAADFYRRNGRRLPPRHRPVIRLHVAGATMREICDETGIRSTRTAHVIVEAFKERMRCARARATSFGPRGRGAVKITARFTDIEAELLHAFARRIGRTLSYTLRAIVMASAGTPSRRDAIGEIVAEIASSDAVPGPSGRGKQR